MIKKKGLFVVLLRYKYNKYFDIIVFLYSYNIYNDKVLKSVSF